METIVAWFIYLCLHFLELCNCYPVSPLTDGSSPETEFGSLLITILGTTTIITIVLLLVGCTWCTRIFKRDTRIGQPIQLQDTGSSEIVDPGILNPLNDIRFPITSPINHLNASPRAYYQDNQEINELPLRIPHHLDAQHHLDNNNLFEDNNNGPISPQELENIVNNNAENYIVSEYENRNLAQREPANEVVQVASISPNHASPRPNILSEYGQWFNDPNEEMPRTNLQYLQVIGRGWFGRIVEGEVHSDSGFGSNANGNTSRVAVKILDENVSSADKCDFLKESQMFKDAKHEHILKYINKNLGQDPWFILFEYCPLGDLKHYFHSNKSQMKSHNPHLPLKFITEAAAALQYLHQENMFYNVACHNCLVGEDISIRLGDYGDDKERYPDHFHPLNGKELPIRWLPPECATESRENDITSNIWSLGVFMWECCSWASLPYGNLSSEQVTRNVLIVNGERLQQPVPNTQYTSYLYNIMQTCWIDDPSLRCNISLVHEYLQILYANFCNPTSQSDKLHDFNARWEASKPNTIPKVDNSLPQSAIQLNDNLYNINFSQCDTVNEPDIKSLSSEVVYQDVAISSETLSVDDVMLKVKSDSLNNLHGSFESVSYRASSRESFNSSHKDENITVEPKLDDISIDKSLLQSAVPNVAPWILEVPFKTPEDISYIKNVSDVISDFDNMLSSEKTSSSESSPSRDASHTSGITCDGVHTNSQMILSENEDRISLEESTTEINSCFKECQSQESAYETNMCSESVNNTLNSVPDASAINDPKDDYPTLDFRLKNLGADPETVHPLFLTNIVNSQEMDSLQDSSYIPDPNKHSENQSFKRSSSGSETEDEVWKRRVELGLISEKIKMKSKSVTDFMVLTHIDMDLTDLESDTSLEGTSNTFLELVQKRLKANSNQQESGLSLVEFSSFPRNCSPPTFNQFTSIKPELDLYKLWKNCKQTTFKNLRPSKSLSELNEFSVKRISREELANFKVKMDSFFGRRKNVDINKKEKEESGTKEIHFKLADPCNSLVTERPINPVFSQNFASSYISFTPNTGEEEDLKFSSNFNDINLNIYSNDNTTNKTSNNSDLWESTKYVNLPDKFNFENQSFSPASQCDIDMDIYDSRKVDENLAFCKEELSNNKTSTPILDNESLKESFVVPHVIISDLSSSKPIPNESSINSLVEQQIDEIIRSEVSLIATKLAIAENENNLNIESSNTNRMDGSSASGDTLNQNDISEAISVDACDFIQSTQLGETVQAINNEIVKDPKMADSLSEVVSQDFDENMAVFPVNTMLDGSQFNVTNEMKERIINNQLIHEIDSELEKLDAACEMAETNYFSPETSESLYDNVDSNYKRDTLTQPSGWYLHPKPGICESIEESPQLNAFPLNLPSTDCSSAESLTDNTNSDQYVVDPESVEALRNELHLKLPLAQRITQMSHENLGNNASTSSKEGSNADEAIPFCKPTLQDNSLFKPCINEASTSTAASSDISLPSQSQGKNEIMIHYNVYGIVPLSPIQEESWSEFSEMEKAADVDSLSLGEETSNIEQVLPFDGVCDINVAEEAEPLKMPTNNPLDDDTYSDCSNRTFVLHEATNSNLKRQQSLSADSLNSIEQFDIDDDNQVDTHKKELQMKVDSVLPQLAVNPSDALLTSFCEDHSHPKSTEEISQNVDNLLETISKTLEDASRIGSVNHQAEIPKENKSDSSESENSGSKTYVIDNKIDTMLDLNTDYNNKIADIPDDVSNVSKVSQPSFVSDITSPDGLDARSEKSFSMHSHTKTLSMDSWCSNDTLFNVEENFDDICIGDLLSPVKKADLFYENTPNCNGALHKMKLREQPQIEMVVGCAENVNNLSVQDHADIMSAFQCTNESPPENLNGLKVLPILHPEPILQENCDGLPENSTKPKVNVEVLDIDLETELDLFDPNVAKTSDDSSENKDMDIVNVTNFQLGEMNMTSTPTTSVGVLNNQSKCSTDSVIDQHFNFLENLSEGFSYENTDDSCLISKITHSFLENEQNFACDAHIKKNLSKSIDRIVKSDKDSSQNTGQDLLVKDFTNSTGLNVMSSPDISDIAQPSYILNDTNIEKVKADVEKDVNRVHFATINTISPDMGSFPDSNIELGTDQSVTSVPTRCNDSDAQKVASFELDKVENNDLESPSFELFKKSAEELPQDLATNADSEYNFSTLQELYSPDIRNIHFTGPLNEYGDNNENSNLLLQTVADVNRVTQMSEEISHIAPERLKDWESESDDSNCSSTSSVEFVWKEGDGSQLLNIPNLIPYQSAPVLKHRGVSQSFEGIPEEGEDSKNDQLDEEKQNCDDDDDEDEEDEEEVDFKPSSWDCHAAPSKSALKSPDTSQIETRKRVVFKKQKYQSIYEYPRDDDTFHTLPDFSTFAEWNAANSNEYVPIDYQHYLSDPSSLSGSNFEDDFCISSSTRPFETYSKLNSSQFFPGQQFSLLSNSHIYGELLDSNEDDFESLPPIPSEQELRQALGDDIDIQNPDVNKKSSDYITPDSGTEDTSPGDLNDFEEILNNKNISEPPQPPCALDEGVDNDIEINSNVKILESGDKTINTSVPTPLGGLRHTRDRLKLDLPPSPLPGNSPCVIHSGKNSNKEVRIFDFKNIDSIDKEQNEINNLSSKYKSFDEVDSKLALKESHPEKCLSSLESDTCDSDVMSPNSVISVIGKFAANVENTTKPAVSESQQSSNPPAESDPGTLQKSIVRIQDKIRRVSLEPVKGEGTLLDSGDEDSGIGSSAYATLERKCGDAAPHPVFVKNLPDKAT